MAHQELARIITKKLPLEGKDVRNLATALQVFRDATQFDAPSQRFSGIDRRSEPSLLRKLWVSRPELSLTSGEAEIVERSLHYQIAVSKDAQDQNDAKELLRRFENAPKIA